MLHAYCVSNFNLNTSQAVYFNTSEVDNRFVIAQHIHKLLDEAPVMFSDVYSHVMGDIKTNTNLSHYPFGYDCVNEIITITNSIVVKRDNIKSVPKDAAFIPTMYFNINGVNHMWNVDHYDQADDQMVDIISSNLGQQFIESVSPEVYFSKGFARFDYNKCKEELYELIYKNEPFEYNGFTCSNIKVAATFDELTAVFPDLLDEITKND